MLTEPTNPSRDSTTRIGRVVVWRWTAASSARPQIIDRDQHVERHRPGRASSDRGRSGRAAAARRGPARPTQKTSTAVMVCSSGGVDRRSAGRLGAEGQDDATLEGEDLTAHLVDTGLVPGVEDVQEQGVGGAACLDHQAAGNQGDHLGDHGQHEVRVGAQVHLDHRVARLTVQLQGRPASPGRWRRRRPQEMHDEPAQPAAAARAGACAVGGSGKTRQTTSATSDTAHDVDG